MKTHAIDFMQVEGHVVRFDDLTNELHIGSELAATVTIENEYVTSTHADITPMHENNFESFEEAIQNIASIIINE